MDENIERRNHYLDLAGIENYTSQFGPGKVGRGEGVASWARRVVVTVPPGLGEDEASTGQVKDIVAGDGIKNIYKN